MLAQPHTKKANSKNYAPERATILYVMSLFVKQNEQRTQLQEKIAADLMDRTKTAGPGAKPADTDSAFLEESQEATGRSVFWVGVVTIVVAALVAFVLFVYNG